jgi:uncharacterized membrane protein
MNSDAFTPTEALRYGWETFKRNVGPALLLALATLLVTFVFDVAQGSRRADAVAFGSTLFSQVAHALLSFLWIRFALAVHDARAITTRELLPSGLMLLHFLAASILYGLLVAAGLVLLIVPGIYLAVRYGLVGFLVADGRADPIGAFHQSSALTRGMRGKLFVLGLLLLVVNLVGAMFFGIGLLLTLPVSAFAATHVYRRLAERAAQLPLPSAQIPPWQRELQQR